MTFAAPIIESHDGVMVVRDDLFQGGTKARFLGQLFTADVDELVYASPAEGGAQTALATVAALLGKRATIFVASRSVPHDRNRMAKRLGAKVLLVKPGYLTVVQAKARAYCAATGAQLVPFGVDLPEAIETVAAAARMIGPTPDEVWCAAGSGVLCRGLAKAWPLARLNAVQIGRKIEPADVAGAVIHVHPLAFGAVCKSQPPFPSDPHYDAKAWEICKAKRARKGRVLFWNVEGPARP